jgi:hypothetical protein
MSGDILNSDRILYGEAMALAFNPRLVDQHASVGRKT